MILDVNPTDTQLALKSAASLKWVVRRAGRKVDRVDGVKAEKKLRTDEMKFWQELNQGPRDPSSYLPLETPWLSLWSKKLKVWLVSGTFDAEKSFRELLINLILKSQAKLVFRGSFIEKI